LWFGDGLGRAGVEPNGSGAELRKRKWRRETGLDDQEHRCGGRWAWKRRARGLSPGGGALENEHRGSNKEKAPNMVFSASDRTHISNDVGMVFVRVDLLVRLSQHGSLSN
jgi:hypothetical protein